MHSGEIAISTMFSGQGVKHCCLCLDCPFRPEAAGGMQVSTSKRATIRDMILGNGPFQRIRCEIMPAGTLSLSKNARAREDWRVLAGQREVRSTVGGSQTKLYNSQKAAWEN